MNAATAKKTAPQSTRKPREEKIRRSTRGCGTTCSTSTNDTRKPAPATRHAQVVRLAQPQVDDCAKPTTLAPIAAAIKVAPAQSIGRRCRFGGMSARRMSATAAIGDRDVDEEDRAPGPVQQVAAHDGTEGGERSGQPEEGGHRAAPLREGGGGVDRGDRGRHQQGGEGALGHAGGDQPDLGMRTGGGRSAERGGNREADDPDQRHPAPAQGVGELAAEGEGRREGHRVGVDRPLALGRGQVEVALEGGGGDGHDGLVDEGHRDREDHRGEDESTAVE